jgi:cell division protein FtsB
VPNLDDGNLDDDAVDAERERLIVRDLIIGAQAEASTAFLRAERLGARNRSLRERVEKQQEEIARLKRRINQLERQGFVGFLRRAKRKLAS